MDAMIISLSVVLGYFGVSVVTYIKLLPSIYKRELEKEPKEWRWSDRWARSNAMAEALLKSCLWPGYLSVYPIVSGINRAAWKPIAEEQERRERLRADRDAWAKKSLESNDPEEIRLYRDLVDVLDETLKTLKES